MTELKPCPFCGGVARIVCFELEDADGEPFDTYSAECCECGICTQFTNRENAEELWNRRTTVETNIYDKEETYPNCTVQVLTNTATGETSVGWWENGGNEDGRD